jgi:hypothetical protein
MTTLSNPYYFGLHIRDWGSRLIYFAVEALVHFRMRSRCLSHIQQNLIVGLVNQCVQEVALDAEIC